MANPALFAPSPNPATIPNTVNEAGGRAYAQPAKAALATFCASGHFNGTYYSKPSDQLKQVKGLLNDLTDQLELNAAHAFVARCAIYSRDRAFLKDVPSFLVAWLMAQHSPFAAPTFNAVIDNGRMIRNVFQYIRSGTLGIRSFNGRNKRLMQGWLNRAHSTKLLNASIGNNPSLADIIKMVRPKPVDAEHADTFRHIIGKKIDYAIEYREGLSNYLTFKNKSLHVAERVDMLVNPDYHLPRWDMLVDEDTTEAEWFAICANMRPQATRMNLNTMARRCPAIFKDAVALADITMKLSDGDLIRESRQYPFQILQAYKHIEGNIPRAVVRALEEGMENAMDNVPEFAGPLLIGIDVSGSMEWGGMGGALIKNVEIAALFAAAILRKNPDSVIMPYHSLVVPTKICAGYSFPAIVKELDCAYGGTDQAAPLRYANDKGMDKFAGAVIISDEQSWIETDHVSYGCKTGSLAAWHKFQKRNNKFGRCKLININVESGSSVQVPSSADVLNVSGFNDTVFDVAAGFLSGDANAFVNAIESASIG
jgi:60 kDa SS-A/Ro ribonucleoprotein